MMLLEVSTSMIGEKHSIFPQAIESCCRSEPDVQLYKDQFMGCYKEIYRVLKCRQSFFAYEWCMTYEFETNNQDYQKNQVGCHRVEFDIGVSLSDIRSTRQCLATIKGAGFSNSKVTDFGFSFKDIIGIDD
uniref:Uncharacterized protein n=1 Tax=Lactuca sativa TaxID=4236 RepID=A0A9R1XMC7_LACSA|nr:hypothetical protein LSAT_V11C300117950 [Lactuca sativa]